MNVMHVQLTGKVSPQFCPYFSSGKIIQKSASCFYTIIIKKYPIHHIKEGLVQASWCSYPAFTYYFQAAEKGAFNRMFLRQKFTRLNAVLAEVT
jgi:hypothetical protein